MPVDQALPGGVATWARARSASPLSPPLPVPVVLHNIPLLLCIVQHIVHKVGEVARVHYAGQLALLEAIPHDLVLEGRDKSIGGSSKQ